MPETRIPRWVALLVAALTVSVLPAIGSGQAKPASGYAGDASCMECHAKMFAPFKETAMGQVMLTHPRNDHEKKGCEACHGPSKTHANSGGEERGEMISFGRKSKTPVAERNASCLQCHEKSARTLWKGSTHDARNVSCADCHTAMHKASDRGNLRKQSTIETCGRCHAQKKAQMSRNAHMPLVEGKMECTSCHSPHGSANEKMLVATSVNETCFSCHTDKRGPYLWEHAPVVENCANCHDSHGGTHEKMLKTARPRLCQQCHPLGHATTVRDPSLPSALPFTFNKSCNNCHFAVHGSNHPAGAFFTR